jgi:peptidyl-prolyl cis-trans isomerase SurA
MRSRWLMYGLLFLCASRMHAGEVLDGILATVNGHVILQSDLDEELRYQNLMSGHEQRGTNDDDREKVLDRLVDRELLTEQISTTEFAPTTADEIEMQLEQVKSDYVQNLKASWTAAVARHGFTEGEIRDRIALELNQWKLIDARLRPSIQIDQSAIDDYYNRQFLPDLRRSGAQPITLQEAAPKIRELLTQQKINEALASWLETLRSQAQIRTFVSNPPQPDQRQ